MEKEINDVIELYKSDNNQEILELFHDEVVNFFRKNRTLNTKPYPIIHSVKSRIKDSEHLKDKLIRQHSKGVFINKDNFFQKINDLIGVRILYLYQEQFTAIHKEIVRKVSEGSWSFFEAPMAYTWDIDTKEMYDTLNIKTEIKDSLYTSVHYLITLNNNAPNPICCEIQVRTLFEETWGEIDHTINYPHPTNSIACKEQLRVLSKLVSTGTRLADAIFKSHNEFKETIKVNILDSKDSDNQLLIDRLDIDNEVVDIKIAPNSIYSEYALADESFPLYNSDNLTRIISNLKIHNWYVQNPAIELLNDINLNVLNEDQINRDLLFVIGRNIYQSSCGGANNSIEFLNNFQIFLQKHTDFVINNLYSGFLYEIYFNSKGELRVIPKNYYLESVFKFQTVIRLKESIEFIRAAIPINNNFFVIPNFFKEIIELEIIAKLINFDDGFGQNYFRYDISSIKLNNQEMISLTNLAPTMNNFANLCDLINLLSMLYYFPKDQVNCISPIQPQVGLFIQYGLGLRKL